MPGWPTPAGTGFGWWPWTGTRPGPTPGSPGRPACCRNWWTHLPLPRNPAVRLLDFRLPPGVDPTRVRRSLARRRTATGNEFLQIRPGAGADTLRLLVARDNALPVLAPYDFTSTDDQAGIQLAVGVDGEPIRYDPALDPHLLLAGLTGSGKSCLAQTLVCGALVRGWQVYVIDPVKSAADYRFARDRCHGFASTAVEATAVLRAVYAEVTRRKQLNADHEVGSYQELPDPPPHIMVLIDEFTSLVGRDPVPPRTGDEELDAERELIEAANHACLEIGVFAGKIAREARSAGVTLALGTQKLSAKMLDTIPGARRPQGQPFPGAAQQDLLGRPGLRAPRPRRRPRPRRHRAPRPRTVGNHRTPGAGHPMLVRHAIRAHDAARAAVTWRPPEPSQIKLQLHHVSLISNALHCE